MKRIFSLIIIILVIWIFNSFSKYCYFGAIDENGEKITDIQEVLQNEEIEQQ